MSRRYPSKMKKNWGKLSLNSTSFLRLKPRPKKPQRERIPGQIQLRIMFGPTESMHEWPKLNGQAVILAEYYENQRYMPIKVSSLSPLAFFSSFLNHVFIRQTCNQGWGTIMLPTDFPAFSDRKGKTKKSHSDFSEPEGWVWNGSWYVDPDIPDADVYGDQNLVVVEVFENERKQPIAGYCCSPPLPRLSSFFFLLTLFCSCSFEIRQNSFAHRSSRFLR